MVTQRYFQAYGLLKSMIAKWLRRVPQRTTDIDIQEYMDDLRNPESMKRKMAEGYAILADIFASAAAHQSTIETKRFVFRFNKYGNGDGSIIHQNHYHIMENRTRKCEIPTLRVEMKGAVQSRIQRIKNVSSRL